MKLNTQRGRGKSASDPGEGAKCHRQWDSVLITKAHYSRTVDKWQSAKLDREKRDRPWRLSTYLVGIGELLTDFQQG